MGQRYAVMCADPRHEHDYMHTSRALKVAALRVAADLNHAALMEAVGDSDRGPDGLPVPLYYVERYETTEGVFTDG